MNSKILMLFNKHGLQSFVLLLLFLTCSQLSYSQPDTIKYTGNPGFCPGFSKTLTADPAPAGATYQWQLNGGPITTGSSFTVSTAGTVTVKVNGISYAPLVISAFSNPVPTFNINNNNTCSGTIIQFSSTVSVGTAPFTYLWNFGDGTSSTSASPAQGINLLGCGSGNVNNTLMVTDANGCKGAITNSQIILRAPDVQLKDSNVFNDFKNCANNPTPANPNYYLKVYNISPNASCVNSYTLDWGDGSAIQTGLTAANFPLSHLYTQLGAFNLVFTGIGSNGCSNSKTYIVANQTNPAGGLGAFGATTGLCAPATVPFLITNWQNNSPGTTYFLDFGDGTTSTLTHPLNAAGVPDTVRHIFATTSCPGSSTYTVTLKVKNACDVTNFTVDNIQVRSKPVPNFTYPNPVCVTQSVLFTNTTTVGAFGSTCTSPPIFSWDFGDPASGGSNTSSLQNPNHLFTAPGTYTVSLTTNNPCGAATITKQICIVAAPVPSFTLDNLTGCTPVTVTATNTSNTLTACAVPTYAWAVTYTASNCGTVVNPAFVFANGTNANSLSPSFLFTNPGTYAIRLSITNVCGTISSAVQTVSVKRPPTVTLPTYPNVCGSVTITPVPTVSNCGGINQPYQWTFTGGTPATFIGLNPGPVSFSQLGTNEIILAVTNECGTTTITKQFTINPIPDVNTTPNDTVCKGATVPSHVFSSALSGTTYTWTNNNTLIGLSAGGTGNVPSFTAANATVNPITATITVTPKNNGCNGTPNVFTITVYPAPAKPTVTTPVNYCQNDAAIPLTATPAPNHVLNWYTVPTGGTASTTSPTPLTTTIGTTSYYVSQKNTAGCEGPRDTIKVIINAVPVLDTAIGTNPVNCATATGFITLSGLAPNTAYTVTYTKNGTPVTVTISSNGTGNLIIPNLSSGTYDNIKVTRLGCASNIKGPVSLVDPNPPATPTAGSNGPVCSGGTLTLTAGNVTGASYTWSGPNGFNSNLQIATIPNITTAASGNYSVTATVSNCTSAAGTVAVIINPTPVNITAASNSPVCSSDTLKLTSSSTTTGAVTYAWTGPNGFTSNSQNPVIPNATVAASGVYSVIATLGSCSATPKTVTATVRPTPVITDSSFINPSSCLSATGSISLMGLANSTSYTVNYLKNGTPVSITISSNTTGVVTLLNLTPGTYSNITVTLNTCTSNSIGPFVLVVPNPPATPTAGSNSPVCVGNPINFTATTTTAGAITYNWTGPNGFISSFQNPVIPNATVAASGNYTVTATVNGCTSQAANITVIVAPNAAVANAGPDQQLCNSSTALLAGNNAGSGTGTWTVMAPSTAVVSQVNNPASAIINLPTGVTKLVWTVSNNVCQPTSDTVIITNLAAVTNALSPLSNTICSGQSFTITGAPPTGGTGSYNFQWQQSFNNVGYTNITGANAINLTVSPTVTTYYRRLINSGACASNGDTAVITVLSGITGNTINASQTICINTAPTLLSGALPSGGGGSFTYSWEQSTDNGLTWTTIAGATNQSYQPGILNVSTRYRRNINTALCGGPQASVSNVITITINPDARALFSPTDTVGCVPFVINPAIINLTPFNAAVSEYRWYVNGAYIGSGQAFPGYTMSMAGDTATIKLVAISRFGCKNDSMQHGFKTLIRAAPAFTQSDSVGCGPIKVKFTNNTLNLTLYTYNWNFGNGQTSTLAQPDTVTFASNPLSGDTVYTVKFITISQCNRDTLLRYVQVKSKPKALFTPDRTTGCSSYNFTFTNTSRGNGNTYIWDFGDGSPLLPTNATQVNHVYTTGNTTIFRVKLKATNECGTDSLIYNLVVTPITIRPDFAVNGNQRFGCLPHTVQFINNSQGGTLYTLNFGDGSPGVSGFNGVDTITHTYTTTGTFTATLRATNSCSDTSDVELITVQSKPAVSFTASPLIACTADTIRFTNLSDTGISYNWRFGDGGTAFTRNTTHIYNTANTFRVWLTGRKIYPGGSCADSAFKDVVIRDTLPGSFTAGTVAATCVPVSIPFVNDNRPAAFTMWTFGDGGTGSGDSVNHTYNQAGIYTVKMISKGLAGCIYTSTKTITVSGLSGTLLYNGGYLCPGIPLRMEVVSPNAPQIRYVFGNGDSLTTTNAIINYTYPQPGTYVPYAYILSPNCQLRLNVGDTVKVDRMRTGFRTQLQQNCGSTTVAFTDTSNAFFGIRSRFWDFGDGTTSTLQNPVKTYTQGGTYSVRLRITGNSNCVDTITIPVSVSVHNYPVSTIGGDTLACISQPLALSAIVQSADAIASYNWDFGNGTGGSGQNITAVYNAVGTYTVRLISRTNFGCADTVYRTVRSNNSPVVNAGPDVTICRGQSVQLGAIGATAWQWSPLQNLSCTTCPNPVANPLFTTSYVVTGSFGTLCRANDTIRVQVIQPFNMTVSPTITLCTGDSVPLFATGAYTYAWSPAGSLNNAFISNPIAKPTATTLYQVVGKDNFNCFTDTDYVRVNVGQYPTVDLGTGATVTAGTVITLNPIITNGPITRYRWTPPTDLSCANCARPVATINNNISYKLEVENAFGCIGSDTINFRVNCDPNQLFIPNAFSPDGDGTNDVLMVRGSGISLVRYFRIFNRWGQLVFERSNINVNDRQQGWDGRINGVAAQPDVYVYTAEAVCTAGSTFVYKGNVTLVR